MFIDAGNRLLQQNLPITVIDGEISGLSYAGPPNKVARAISELAPLSSCLPCEQPPNAFGLSRRFFLGLELGALFERYILNGLQYSGGDALAVA
jgi:hypothetical protein